MTPLVTVEAYVENALNEVSYLSNAPTYIRGPLWLATAAKPRVIGIQATARY